MSRTFIIIIAFLFFALKGSAQSDTLFRLVKEYNGSINDFAVDNLGNLYILYDNGQLKKLRPNGDSLAVFNNVRRFGKKFTIDVTNPLKVLLFYRDFGTVVILDRFLNERATLDLRRQGLLQVRAVGQAYDNNIWVSDELDNRLKKIGDDGKIIDQSADFRQIFDSVPRPVTIIDQDKLVYLYDPEKGVYMFDYYGGFKGRIPFTGWLDFNVLNNSLVGRDPQHFYRYDNGTLQLKQSPIPSYMQGATKIAVGQNIVHVLKDRSIMVYSYH